MPATASLPFPPRRRLRSACPSPSLATTLSLLVLGAPTTAPPSHPLQRANGEDTVGDAAYEVPTTLRPPGLRAPSCPTSNVGPSSLPSPARSQRPRSSGCRRRSRTCSLHDPDSPGPVPRRDRARVRSEGGEVRVRSGTPEVPPVATPLLGRCGTCVLLPTLWRTSSPRQLRW
jgi:hypothetical protein